MPMKLLSTATNTNTTTTTASAINHYKPLPLLPQYTSVNLETQKNIKIDKNWMEVS